MMPGAGVPTRGGASRDVRAGWTSPGAACRDTSAMGKSTSARRLHSFGNIEYALYFPADFVFKNSL